MTPEQCAAAAKAAVVELDTAWSTSPKTLRRARVLELSGWAFAIAGRGGALGSDCRPETVAAALGFIAPDAVRAGWEAAGKVSAADVAASRLAECARWGDENLVNCLGLPRLVSLAERAVEAVDASAMPLFAAWRAMPMPDGGPGARAAVLIHLLREHRAGARLLAVRCCGLTPVEALIAEPDGEAEAIALGWAPPFPARTPLIRRHAYAEALTDRLAGPAYAALTVPERVELVGLLAVAVESASGAG
ncbi:MAG: helix-turn-helix domain-containing protein [Micromonosporaceae bacterium]